ncbi:unnamed protein product [Auanema sp. JU1783]|nr:unnamed protein product [Auanema sp. JU1783]
MVSSEWDKSFAIVRSFVGDDVPAERIENVLLKFSQNGTKSLTIDESNALFRRVLHPLQKMKIALLVVDFQNDFVTGSLSIKNGDSGDDPIDALPSLNTLIQHPNLDSIVYTMDWHPSNHISFYEHARNSDRVLSPDDKIRKLRPFDIVRFEIPNTVQILYPTHCVQGSWGAQLHPQMIISPNAKYIRKGTDVHIDSYSAFKENDGARRTELDSLLRDDGITAVLACGLAYDICVMHTLKDAASLGYLSAIVTDCSKGLSTEKKKEADDLFRAKKVAIVSEDTASSIIDRQAVPIEWLEALACRSK